MDQWRYVLALGGAEGADRGALERASALNPFDSAVQLRLASAARLSGDEAAVERDLRRAVAVGSHSPAPYHALERFLIESGRWQDAYAHCQLLLERWPREVDTIVNAGVLAQKLNDPAAAERWWRRALDADDSLRHVHLYLAELLDGRSRAPPRRCRTISVISNWWRAPRRTTRISDVAPVSGTYGARGDQIRRRAGPHESAGSGGVAIRSRRDASRVRRVSPRSKRWRVSAGASVRLSR